MSAPDSRSEQFRARVDEAYDPESLTPRDHELIAEVMYALDTLDAIRDELKSTALTEIRQGGPRVSPLVVEERLRSQALSSLLMRAFPDLADE